MNKWLLVYVGFLIAFLAPHFISIVARQAWPLWVKRIAALVLVVPFVAMMGYALARPLPFGSNVPEPLVDGFLVLCLAWTLFGATRDWPRAGGRPELSKDVRVLVDTAVAAAELQLGLTAMKRLERPNPPGGSIQPSSRTLLGWHLAGVVESHRREGRAEFLLLCAVQQQQGAGTRSG